MNTDQTALQTPEDVRQEPPTRSFQWPLLVQGIAYIVLLALAMLPHSANVNSSEFSLTAFAVAVMIMLFAFFAPLRDGRVGRGIAVIFGFIAMIVASTPMLGNWMFNADDADPARSRYLEIAAWFAGVAVLLVALIVVGFIREMLREQRTNMIIELSHTLTDGVASIAASGWCFLPMLIHETQQPDAWRIVGVIAVIILAIALALVSRLWYRDAQPMEDVPSPWIGFGLLPVMLTGGLVGIAALILWFI